MISFTATHSIEYYFLTNTLCALFPYTFPVFSFLSFLQSHTSQFKPLYTLPYQYTNLSRKTLYNPYNNLQYFTTKQTKHTHNLYNLYNKIYFTYTLYPTKQHTTQSILYNPHNKIKTASIYTTKP